MQRKITYEDLLKEVAANIRKHRKRLGLTQEQMADRGFNYRFYQKLESGIYSPNVKTLFRLAQVFDIKPSKLLAD